MICSSLTSPEQGSFLFIVFLPPQFVANIILNPYANQKLVLLFEHKIIKFLIVYCRSRH